MHLQSLFFGIFALPLVFTFEDNAGSWLQARQQALYERDIAQIGDLVQRSVYNELDARDYDEELLTRSEALDELADVLTRRSRLERRLVLPYSVPRYGVVDSRYAEIHTTGTVRNPLQDQMVNLVCAMSGQVRRHPRNHHIVATLGIVASIGSILIQKENLGITGMHREFGLKPNITRLPSIKTLSLSSNKALARSELSKPAR